jgi:hypothetical protein
MRVSRLGLLFVAVFTLVLGTESQIVHGDDVGAAANKEVASARAATVRYHDLAQALADGYALEGYVPGEGFEYVNGSLIDCTFDPEQPEALHYIPSGNDFRFVGVEYIVPIECVGPEGPEGFSGDSDEWEFMAEGFPIWALNAWLWIGNPNGVFAEPPHPSIP